MKSNISGWDDRVKDSTEVMAFIDRLEQKFKKQIVLDDIQNHPTPCLVNGLLGSVRATKSEVFVYINDKYYQRLSFHQKGEMQKSSPKNLTTDKRSAVYLFLHVICHELLHYEMDREGYPVTRNHDAYTRDISVSNLGTLLQASVIHGELARRQIQQRLPYSVQKPPHKVLIDGLSKAGISLDEEKKNRICSLCHVDDSGIDGETARCRLYELVELLGLDNRLKVDLQRT